MRENAMPADRLTLTLCGESLELFSERALYWPARQRLILADLHLGKGDIFRRAGISLPTGGTAADLARIDRLLAVTSARSLWLLGDSLHGKVKADSDWLQQWHHWRASHQSLSIAALAGNHDPVGALPLLGVETLGNHIDDGPFRWQHMPGYVRNRYLVCSHLHPVARLPGLPGRLPVFWIGSRQAVLPAFSGFTGGSLFTPEPTDTLVVCAGNHLVSSPGEAFQ